MSRTGGGAITRVGADDDAGDVAEKAVPISAMSALSSRRPSSSAMVGGGTARSSLNLELFWTMGGAVADGVADASRGAIITAGGARAEGWGC